MTAPMVERVRGMLVAELDALEAFYAALGDDAEAMLWRTMSMDVYWMNASLLEAQATYVAQLAAHVAERVPCWGEA